MRKRQKIGENDFLTIFVSVYIVTQCFIRGKNTYVKFFESKFNPPTVLICCTQGHTQRNCDSGIFGVTVSIDDYLGDSEGQ